MSLDAASGQSIYPVPGRTTHPVAAILAAAAVLLVLLSLLAWRAGHVAVGFETDADVPTRLQVFYDKRADFAESRSRWLLVSPGSPATIFFPTQGREASWLRVDTDAGMGASICHLRLDGVPVGSDVEVKSSSGVRIQLSPDCLQVLPVAGSADPQVLLHFTGASARHLARAGRWQRVVAWAGLLALCAACGWLWLMRSHVSRSWSAAAVSSLATHVDSRLHTLVAMTMLIIGLAYVAMTPPGAVADEGAHLAKIVRIAHGVPFGAGTRALPDPRPMYGPFSDYLRNKKPFTSSQLQVQLRGPLACVLGYGELPGGGNGYFPHQYLLPAATYALGCAAHASFGQFLYLSRGLNLLLSVGLVCFGLAYAGRGKLGLAAVALLPMSMFQMSSISADSMWLSLSLCWLGVVSGIASGALHPRRAAPALWVLGLSIAFLKPGSAWVLCSLLFCREAYAASGQSFAAAAARHVGLPLLVHAGWTLAMSANAPLAAGADSALTLHTLLAHPAQFPLALLATLQAQAGVLGQMLVGVLGWLDVPLDAWAYRLAFLALLASLFADAPQPLPRRAWVPPLALALAAASVALLAFPLLLFWTPTGSQLIAGLQGRYFLVTLAFMLAHGSITSPERFRRLLVPAVLLAMLVINVHALLRLHEAYYVIGRN